MLKKVNVLKEDKTELLADIDENESLGKQVCNNLKIYNISCSLY